MKLGANAVCAMVVFAFAWTGELFAQGTAGTTKEEPAKNKDSKRTDREFEEIVVIGSKETYLGIQSGISENELLRVQLSKTVDGLLENLAGIDLNRKSVVGSENGRVRIRGFDEKRLLIQLGGRSLHGAGVYGGYFVDWASLSLEEVDRIEIIRGVAPVKYGNTLGGVLNIVTRTGSTEPRTIFRGAGGSLRSWNAQLSHTWGIGPFRYSLSAGHYETDGYLRNSFVDRNTIAGKVTFELPAKLKLSTSARYNANKCGMTVYNKPDSPYYEPDKPDALESALGGPFVPFMNHGEGKWGPLDWGDRSHWKEARAQFDAALSRDTDRFDFALRAYLLEQDREEYFYAIGDPRHLTLKRGTEPEKHNWGWRADLKSILEAFGTHVLEYGAEGNYLGYGGITIGQVDESYFSPQKAPSESPGKPQISMLHGAYLQDLWQIAAWLDIELGLRLDSFVADGPEENAPVVDEVTWSPQVAITARPWEAGYVAGRYRRAYRFPTLPEYHWWYSGYQPENRKDLRSENANQLELEVGHNLIDKFAVVLRGYHYAVDDYIRTIFGYRPSRVIYNIDRVDFTGFEVEGSYGLPHHLEIWANYTWQIAKKYGDVLDSSSSLSDELVELPRNKVNLAIRYHDEDGLKARFVARYVDLRRTIRGDLTTVGESQLEKMDPFVDLDLFASYPVLQPRSGGEVRIEVAVENLSNHHYVEEFGFPMPGIVFMAGMRTTL